MKMIALLAAGTLAFAMSGCGGDSEKHIISVEKKADFKKLAPVHPNRKMTIAVDGMSCVHACGGSIRMALKETGAVDRVSFDFETGRKTNTAFITYDKNKISPDKIVSIIEKINDKQFTTGKSSSTDIESTDEAGDTDTSGKESGNETASMSSTTFEFPNIYKLFASLIQ